MGKESIGRVEMKKLMVLIGILLLVGLSSAMTIQGSDYTGTIEFHENGVGTAFVDGFPPTMFQWNWVKDDLYEARYLWYRVDFTYINGVITSSSFPGARLV